MLRNLHDFLSSVVQKFTHSSHTETREPAARLLGVLSASLEQNEFTELAEDILKATSSEVCKSYHVYSMFMCNMYPQYAALQHHSDVILYLTDRILTILLPPPPRVQASFPLSVITRMCECTYADSQQTKFLRHVKVASPLFSSFTYQSICGSTCRGYSPIWWCWSVMIISQT